MHKDNSAGQACDSQGHFVHPQLHQNHLLCSEFVHLNFKLDGIKQNIIYKFIYHFSHTTELCVLSSVDSYHTDLSET